MGARRRPRALRPSAVGVGPLVRVGKVTQSPWSSSALGRGVPRSHSDDRTCSMPSRSDGACLKTASAKKINNNNNKLK